MPRIQDPTPSWLKPENASVLDSPVTKALRIIAGLIGADDPQSQVLGLMAPLEIKAFHGSPVRGLSRVSANPSVRQYDNATSQFGGFFSPYRAEAQRYAGEHGQVYRTKLNLQNPYEMDYLEFKKFQDIHKDAAGKSALDWGARMEELKREAAALRQRLVSEGYDGIVVRNTRGVPIEIASFADVRVRPDGKVAK